VKEELEMTSSKRPDHNRKAPPRGLAEGIAAMLEGFGRAPKLGDMDRALVDCAKRLRAQSARLAREYPGHYAPRCADALADHCEQIAESLAAIGESRDDEQDLLVATAGAVHGGIGLSQALAALAGSYRDAPDERASEPNPAELRAAAGKAAWRLFDGAMRLSTAAGFPNIAPVAFAWPRARGCGCCPPSAPPEAAPAEPLFEIPEFDGEAFENALERLLMALAALFLLIELFARFHRLLLAYFDEYWYTACSNDCTGPNGRIVSITMTKSYSSTDNTATPLADGDVDLCCSSICMGFWTEWDVVTKQVVGVVVGPACGVGREAAAAAAAAKGGPAFRAAVMAAPPVC
jgi:hypothetical protein